MSPPATFQNLGFETAGAAAGLAAGWTLAFQASVDEVAGYGAAPAQPHEDFERGWGGNEAFLFDLPPTRREPALYDEAPVSVEDFEDGWSQNEAFQTALASLDAADYDAGPASQRVEDFEGRWAGNEAFVAAFTPGTLAAAPAEPFEAGWRGNQAFRTAFGASDLAAGPAEPFEAGWPAMTTL